MIRKGSRVERYDTLAAPIDRERLRALIESAFGRALRPGVLDHPIARAYVEENYLGAALMTSTPVGIYLSKFAVDRQAQGEGIGGDLWNVMTRDYPGFFWRTRATNPINSWYLKNCDGVARLEPWNVYWRGLTVAELEPAIRYALAATVDFVS